MRDLARKENLKVSKWLSEARSAKAPNVRPVFREMLDLINEGKADAILCWHLNRLSRNELESGELQWMLRTGKIKLIKTPEREYRPEDHALLMAVESSMAAQYVRDLKRDVERRVAAKAEKGWYPYKPKSGYLVDPFTKEVIPDPVRFVLLRRAFEMMLTGQYTVPQVLSALNASGFRSPRNRGGGGNTPMSRSGLYRLFSDKFYAGYFTYEGVEYLGRHRPMVSLEEWNRVRKLLKRPEHGKPQKYFHPFAGIIHCGVCGCLITAETHTKPSGRSYVYYHCTGHRGCTKESVSEGYLEGRIKENLLGVKLDPSFANWALSVLDREELESRGTSSIVSDEQDRALGSLTRRLDRLYRMREDEEITADEFKARKAKLLKERNGIEQAIHDEENASDRKRQELRELITFSRDAYDRFTNGLPELQGEVARSFSKHYVLTQGKLEIGLHPGLDRIRTFEPTKRSSQSKNDGPSGTVSPAWRTMLDELRKSVGGSDLDIILLPYIVSS